MFSRFNFGKKGKPVTLEVFLDHSVYEKFRSYMARNCLDEGSALVKLLERGMTNYWLYEFKQMKISYLHLKKLFEDYKKDNEFLNSLRRENDRLRSILEKSKIRGTKNEDDGKPHV